MTDKNICKIFNMDIIGFLIDIGFVVHPIDEEKFIYGVFSSESKIFKRFEKVIESFPNAELFDSKNFCEGDYIIYLKGKPITTLEELYNSIKTVLNIEEYDNDYRICEISRILKEVEGL